MTINIEKDNREMWLAKNISEGNITIGDLPLLPVIHAERTVNLLRFYSREKVIDSKILTFLVQKNKITIEKKIKEDKKKE
jgi:hypothetical protein